MTHAPQPAGVGSAQTQCVGSVRMLRLLDLFCGAGGAAMGYHRAGFDVVGVDNRPMPRYPFEFHQADALEYFYAHWQEFDKYHGSPPCPRYANVTRWRHGTWDGDQTKHPDLIGTTRAAFRFTGRPFVIENVRTTELRSDLMLCGSMFGLAVQRHRYFEFGNCDAPFMTATCRHVGLRPFEHKDERAYADAMGCDWMNKTEARQAIPPAYTEYIGRHLLAALHP